MREYYDRNKNDPEWREKRRAAFKLFHKRKKMLESAEGAERVAAMKKLFPDKSEEEIRKALRTIQL